MFFRLTRYKTLEPISFNSILNLQLSRTANSAWSPPSEERSAGRRSRREHRVRLGADGVVFRGFAKSHPWKAPWKCWIGAAFSYSIRVFFLTDLTVVV